MRNPLKQGLKQIGPGHVTLSGQNRNAKSTKTRIETVDPCIDGVFKSIAMRNPLKQGLKHVNCLDCDVL